MTDLPNVPAEPDENRLPEEFVNEVPADSDEVFLVRDQSPQADMDADA